MMIPDIQFSLLCEDVRREMSGNFQFLGVVADNLVVKQLPVRFFRLNVANRWTSGEGTFTQKTAIMGPDGHTPLVTGREIPVRLADGSTEAYSILGEWDSDEALHIVPCRSRIAEILLDKTPGAEVVLPAITGQGRPATLEAVRPLPDAVRAWIAVRP